jgi:hypothetical protein
MLCMRPVMGSYCMLFLACCCTDVLVALLVGLVRSCWFILFCLSPVMGSHAGAF